jgi:hypothetical protein
LVTALLLNIFSLLKAYLTEDTKKTMPLIQALSVIFQWQAENSAGNSCAMRARLHPDNLETLQGLR